MTPWLGYGTAPLPDAPHRILRRPLGAEPAGAISGQLTVRWRADQPVHLPGGPWTLHDGQLTRPAWRQGPRLGLAGAALRAAARARHEAITRACAGTSLRPRPAPGDPFAPCAPPAPLCPTCALFGAPGHRGRISFDAALAEPDLTPQRHPLPRNHRAPADLPERRLIGGPGQPDAPPYGEVETLPLGAELQGRISLDALDPAQAGALLAALGLAPGTFSKLGLGRALGLGRLRPIHVDWQLTDPAGAPLRPDPAHWRAAFTESPDYWRPGEEAVVRHYTRGDW